MFSSGFLEGKGFFLWWVAFLGSMIIGGIGAVIGSDDVNTVGGVLVFILWIAAGILGVMLLRRKYYLTFKTAGIALLLFGWWVPILLYIGGPFVWWIARSLRPRRKCPACKQIIPGDANRCPHCGVDVTPII